MFFKSLCALCVATLMGFVPPATAEPTTTPSISGWQQFDFADGEARGGKWERRGIRGDDVSVTFFFHVRASASIDGYFSDQVPKMFKRYAGGAYKIKKDKTDEGDLEGGDLIVRRVELRINGNKRNVVLMWRYENGVFMSAFVRPKGKTNVPDHVLDQVVTALR